MNNQKEVVFAFNHDVKEMPILLSSGLLEPEKIGLSWKTIIMIAIIYTLIWGILYYTVYNKVIFTSVLHGYLFGLIIYFIGEYFYRSKYRIFQDETNNEFTQFYTSEPYMVMKKNDVYKFSKTNIQLKDKTINSVVKGQLENKIDNYGFIIDNKKFKENLQKNVEAVSYGEYSRTHNISNKFNGEPGLRGTFPLGVDTAFKLVLIIVSIGILVSNRKRNRFNLVIPWIIYVVIFSLLQESIWLWNSFTYAFENELWVKNFLLLVSYALSITVISITLFH
jgi:hypothetical protein